MDEEIKVLKEYIEESQSIVAITGAGISFSTGGLNFAENESSDYRSLANLGSLSSLRNDPDNYYKAFDKAFLHAAFVGGPTPAHKALAKLEEEGKLTGIITTNIDCLHTMAGNTRVAEIQGSLQINKCMDCGKHFDDYDIWAHGECPLCDECGGPIWTFPFYSHIGLNDEEVKKARKYIAGADLVLVIGSNGMYAGSYWNHINRRAVIIQINPGSTVFDSVADLNIHKGADEVLSEVVE